MSSNGSEDERATRNERIALLASHGQRHSAIAATVGVSIRSVRRVLADPAVRLRVQELRAATFDAAAGQLAERLDDAIQVLVQLMTDSQTQDAVRLGAAVRILEYAAKMSDRVDLEARVTAIEASLSHASNLPLKGLYP